MLYLPPRGIDAGKGVKIMRPREIGASNRIHIGADTEIGRGCMITPIVEHEGEEFTPVIEIGKNVYIGPHLYMVAIGKLTIGDGCVLSEHVFLNDCSHGLNPLAGPIMRQRLVHGGDITIGKSCFLGYRASIMPGVILGEHCVVGANSVVTRSFPAYSMIVGAPAKLIKVFSLDRGEWIAPTS